MRPRVGGVRAELRNALMFDDPAQLRLKAEACRRLADITDDAEREALWLKRAIDWEQLAMKIEKKQRYRRKD